ncbi:MAG TPA: hypothetical protein VLY04_02780 [Bryobacteraceae bacterium]|nr:hypothetical protein [Bryobacteraceae bacterium]
MIVKVLVALLVLGLMGWSFWQVARAFLRFRGTRIVGCPETGQPAAVELAAWHIAVTAPLKPPALLLRDCSRWRERPPCDQACCRQIAASPEDCLLVTILSKWYQDKACACCGRPLAPVNRSWHKPGLMDTEMRIFEWNQIPAQNIPRALTTHTPVCWTCLVAETHIS